MRKCVFILWNIFLVEVRKIGTDIENCGEANGRRREWIEKSVEHV